MKTQRKLARRSKRELMRIVADAVNSQFSSAQPGLWFAIDDLETDRANPPGKIRAWGTLHFTPDGSPFCCGEPLCHIGPTTGPYSSIPEAIRRSMNLAQDLTIELKIGVMYHEGVEFHYGIDAEVV